MAASAANSCTYTYSDKTTATPTNYTFNYARMTRTSNFYTGTERTYFYEMNPCGIVTDVDKCQQNGATLCQLNMNTPPEYVATVASWTKTPDLTWSIINPSSPAIGAKQTYTNGDTCYIFGQPRVRTAVITYLCGTKVFDTFAISEDDNTCTFNVEIQSPYACAGGSSGGGSSSGLSGGSVFIIILVVVIPVYVIVGCIYKKQKLGTSGIESCPNIEFWRDLPNLVKEGAMYTFSGCKKGSDSHYDEL